MTQTAEQRRLLRLADAYNRKAQRIGAVGTVAAYDLYRLPRTCPYCGIGLEDGQGTFDHTIPFNRGGSNTIDNITRCCITCNREKFDKTVPELFEYRRLWLKCPIDGTIYKPRWGEWKNGRARVCSLSCAAKSRWQEAGDPILVEGPNG